jgi:DNA end-binding protein Ku
VVPSGEVLMMITMRYVNQIREHSEFDFPSTSAKSSGVTAKEMELARKLIDDMTGPWKPEAFEDTYNDDLMRRIKEKVKAGEAKLLTKPEGEKSESRGAQVIDLMELLKQSIGNAGGRGRKAGNGTARKGASVTKVADAPKARARKAAEPRPAARRKRA